jgi:hypothetical protein
MCQNGHFSFFHFFAAETIEKFMPLTTAGLQDGILSNQNYQFG